MILIFWAVVQVDRAEGCGEDGGSKPMAEQFEGHIYLCIGAERIHVDEYLLPFIKVTRGGVAGVLAAGAGHGVCAGSAVAHGAGLAVGADLILRGGQDIIIIHILISLCYNWSATI